jgi:hypothetical protein
MPYRTPGEQHPRRELNPGGTHGGTGQFVIGLAMLIAGGYLFLDNVVVSTYGWGGMFGWGQGSFGLSLIPLFIGVAILFFNGSNPLGWVLTGGGFIIIVVGVISKLQVRYKTMSLFDTLLIFVLIAGGIGLIARSLKEQ